MTRSLLVCGCALFAGLAAFNAQPASAGGYVVGVYPMFGYRGFYSNGFSMHGPPVPTYFTVAGIFNGSDQHSYDGPGWFVPRQPATPPGPDGPVMVTVQRANQSSGSKPLPAPLPQADREDEAPPPRELEAEAPPVNKDRPAAPPLPPADREEEAPPPRKLEAEAPAVIEVRLPDAAGEVVINGRPTQQTGIIRVFESPPLPARQIFLYDVKARWQGGGRPVVDDRTLAVEAGKRFLVDFTAPLPAR